MNLSKKYQNIPGTNNPNYGKHLSEPGRRKISLALKGQRTGKDHHNFGKHLSKVTREKISEKLLGRPLSEETKKKVSRGLLRYNQQKVMS